MKRKLDIKNPMLFINSEDGELTNLAERKYKKQILRFGKWLYDDGEFEVNKEKAMELVANFKGRTVENVPVVRGHATQDEMDKNPDLIAGYVEDLEVADDGVYAVIKTADDEADEQIGVKYKNVSASIDSNYQDHESGDFKGWVMRHLALTVEPYIKALNPNFIALSDEYNKKILNINLTDMGKKINLEDEKTEAKEVVEETKVEEKPEEKKEKAEEIVEVSKEEEAKIIENVKAAVEEVKADAKPGAKEEPKEEPKEEVKEEVEKKVETMEEIEARIREKLKAELKAEVVEEVKKELEQVPQADGAEKESKNTMALEEKSANSTNLSELELQLKKSKDRIKELELNETESEVRGLLEKGAITPAQKEIALSLLRSKNIVSLAEGKSDNVANAFRAFLGSLTQVDFSEKGVPPKTKTEKDQPEGILIKDKKEFERLSNLYK